MPEDWIVSHNTPACAVCGERSVIDVSADALKAWKDGVHIQLAFPELNADQRELLLTGTHPACWDELVPNDEGECSSCDECLDCCDEHGWTPAKHDRSEDEHDEVY